MVKQKLIPHDSVYPFVMSSVKCCVYTCVGLQDVWMKIFEKHFDDFIEQYFNSTFS